MKTVMMQKALPRWLSIATTAGLLAAVPSWAQVPVDENGNPVEAIDETAETDVQTYAIDAAEENLTIDELQALVGPIALYPDDLLAIVLPASAYPLQIVQAARFLEDLEQDSSLKPDESWDESVTALLNYPEVIEMMNEDLDWTYELGEAVVRQQADVIAAVEAFRDRAYAAGNLKSDEHQTVSNDNGVVEIEPVEEEVIYVPYYEPERVVVYQPQPVYHYYPRAYPVYYYPYPHGYSFASGYFWGVTTAFQIGWFSDHLHVFHHSYWGHPYYGRHYFSPWYRRPSISIYNRFYVNNHVRRPPHHERDGDFWRPRRHSGALQTRHRFREAYYSDRRSERTEEGYRNSGDARRTAAGSSAGARAGFRGDSGNAAERNRNNRDGDIAARFARSRTGAGARNDDRDRETATERRRQAADRTSDDDRIRFRPRERAGVTRRADDETAIRFRARERAENRDSANTRAQPQRTEPRAQPQRTEPRAQPQRTEPRAQPQPTERESRRIDRPSRPSIRRPDPTPAAVRERAVNRSSSISRRATPAPPAASRAPAVQSRASTPRASTPRPSTPRAAPRVSRPSAASPPAPSRESRAAPRRASSDSSSSSQRRRHNKR